MAVTTFPSPERTRYICFPKDATGLLRHFIEVEGYNDRYLSVTNGNYFSIEITPMGYSNKLLNTSDPHGGGHWLCPSIYWPTTIPELLFMEKAKTWKT